MKTITIKNVEYKIHDYLSAPDMVGINMNKLLGMLQSGAIIRKKSEEDKNYDGGTAMLSLYNENFDILIKIAERLIISPKLPDRPRPGLIITFMSNPDYIESISETFSDLFEMIETDATDAPKNEVMGQ